MASHGKRFLTVWIVASVIATPLVAIFLGPILPPWNGMTLIRNTLYFDGNAITQQIIVLSIYVIAGAILVTIFSWGRLLWWRAPKRADHAHRSQVISPQEEAGVAAVPPA